MLSQKLNISLDIFSVLKTGDIALLKLQSLTKNVNDEMYPISYIDFATDDNGIFGQ